MLCEIVHCCTVLYWLCMLSCLTCCVRRVVFDVLSESFFCFVLGIVESEWGKKIVFFGGIYNDTIIAMCFVFGVLRPFS